MLDEKIKEIQIIENYNINENKSINENNINISPMTQKNKKMEEKKNEINSCTKTSDCSQKSKNNENKSAIEKNKKEDEKEKCINNTIINSIPSINNNSKILLNKEQLYETFLLFQKFLLATNSINKEKMEENMVDSKININNSFMSTISNLKDITYNKDNNNDMQNMLKEISNYERYNDNQKIIPLTDNNITSNFQEYNKSHVNKKNRYKNISLLNNSQKKANNNSMKSNKESLKKYPLKKDSNILSSSSKNNNRSKESIKEFRGINYNKINSNNKKINESFIKNNKNASNDYSYDFSNNNMDSCSGSNGDSFRMITNDLIPNKNKKINLKINSIKTIRNHNKTSKSIEMDKIIENLNNEKIKTERDTSKKNLINSYNNKGEDLINKIKKITVTKNTTMNKDKDQIIEEKIKELNNETIKFREERDKVIKLKKEYEKLHEKLNKDIENFNQKKEEFEKYRLDELNKIKEEKKNIESQTKLITNIKKENQSLNISNKNDKETINHLRDYISQLKTIIKKKDEEIKQLSKNNNNINNYIINSYKAVGICKDGKNSKFNKIENKNKSFRNSMISKNIEGGYMTNLFYTKSKNYVCYNENINNNNISNMNKSNSVIYLNDYSKIQKKKGRNDRNIEENDKINSFSGNSLRSKLKLNTSTNKKNEPSKLNLNLNKDIKVKKYHHKKINSGNIANKNNSSKRKESKNYTKIDNINSYINVKTQGFSKTTSNFRKQKLNIEKDNNNKLLEEESKQILGNITNEKMDLKNDFQNELDKPLNKEEYEFHIPEQYIKNECTLVKKEEINDKEICFYSNNKKEIKFPSGLKKEIFNDGFQIIYFNNGDIKQNYPDGKTVYFFKDANTVQTTYPNKVQVFKFYNGQIEKHFPNGFKKIFFPNGTVDYTFSDKKTN